MSFRTLLTMGALMSFLFGLVIHGRVSLGYTQRNRRPDTSIDKHTIQRVQDCLELNSSELKRETREGLKVFGNDEFYIYTAVVQQPKNASKYEKLYITGWEPKSSNDQYFLCCVGFTNGTVRSTSSYKLSWGLPDEVMSRQVVCNISNIKLEEAPKWASLSHWNETCVHRKEFREIEYIRPVTTPSFAICGKIAYGKKDPRYLIEWLEYHKYMGVSKFVIYSYADLLEPARRVLKHYTEEGILETLPLPFVPLLDQFPRHFSVQNSIMWQDEKVPLFDTQQRLRPYSYIGVLDTDEFIVPKHPRIENLVDLMGYLLRTYRNGGTFTMETEMHIMDWGKTNNDSDLMIEQYGNRTNSMTDNPKYLIVNDRIKSGSIWIHHAKTKNGFTGIVLNGSDTVVLKHFRGCRDTWLVVGKDGIPNKCHGGFKRRRDTFMERVAEKIGPNIRRVKSLLHL